MSGRITFSAKLEGGAKVEQRFIKISNVIDDARPLFKRLGNEIIFPEIKSVFRSEGKPKWSPLAASTMARKSAGKILVKTGKLKKSLITNTSSNSIWRMSKNRLEVGSKLKTSSGRFYLGSLNQEGTKKMPARELYSKSTIKKIYQGLLKIGLSIVGKSLK